jgi:hypothetical protein
MNKQQTNNRDAVWTAPLGLAGIASRVLVGAVALLLISGPFSAAWAIIGGGPDNSQHPYVGAMIGEHPQYGRMPFTGFLVHPRVIVTAGHMTAALLGAGLSGPLGISFDPNVNVNDPNTWEPVTVTNIISAFTAKSPLVFGYGSQDADIGIFILDKPVQGITPATLPPVGLLDWLKATHQLEAGPDASLFTEVGYGFGFEWPPPQPIFPVSDQGICPRKVVQSAYMSVHTAWLFLSQNQARGYGGAGLGDSGGPVLWTDPETGVEYVVGVCSGGSAGWIGFSTYFRLDTPWALQFIQDAIDSVDAN